MRKLTLLITMLFLSLGMAWAQELGVSHVAKIGEQGYETLAAALDATKTMTGDVTVEILDKVTFNQPLIGSYSSINFVGKAENAEMYLDVQGYITATGKKVSFTDLKLSKSEGGFITNAGFMNVAFGIYDVEEVSYTNCTFENGACASSGKVTFNGCTFKKSWDKYGLWAYGNVDVTVQGSTFADYRGIKMYAENGADASVEKANLTVKNTNFSAVNNKPAIVLTYGESVVLEGNTYSSTGTFELDLDGKPNGVAVTSDVAPVCVNGNGACGVLVDGKIYTTVAQAAEVASSGSTVTLLHNSAETVALPMGVTLNKNNFEAAGVTVAAPVAMIGDVAYNTLGDALAALKDGETLVITSDITPGANEFIELNGKTNVTLAAAEGVVINGNIQVGYHPSHVDAADRSASTFTVDGLTVKGTLTVCSNDAALVVSDTKAAQITVKTYREGMDIALNGNTADGSMGAAANGYGMYLVPNATGYDLAVDGNTFKNINSHAFVIQGCGDGSAVTAANSIVVQNNTFESWGTGGKNNRAAFKIWADTKYAPVESGLEGTTNAMRELVDEIAASNNTYSSTADNTVEFDAYGAAGDAADFPAPMYPVAKIGEQGYETLEEAFKAATDGCTIDILSDVTVDYNWDARNTGAKFTVPVTINGNGKTIKFTASVNDNNYQAAFRFEADATVKNLTVDMSEVTDSRFRAISSKGNLTVDGCTFIGKDETLNCRAVIFGEGAGANVGNLAVAITNSEFINWKRGITDNENAQDVKTVTITGNTLTDAGVGVSAKETVTFTGNTVAGAYVNIKSYTAGNKLAVTATGNTLEANTDAAYNVIDAGGVVNAEGFNVVAKGGKIIGYTSTEGIWGEVWGNARNSFVIKVLDANDNVMGTSSLNNVGGIIDGDVTVSWNLKFNAASNTDEYWTMAWTTAPTINNMPAKVQLWVDGVKVSEGNVVLNGPDNLWPIAVAVTDENGVIKSCAKSLKDAIAAGNNVAILKAGTYALEVKDGLTITGAVEGVEFANIGAFGCNGANVTFNNVTFTYAENSTYKGLQHSGNLAYNNCTFNGQVFLYGQSETFNKCTFNTTDSNNYNVWTYGAKEVAFNECTFNSAGKSVLIYHEDANMFNDVAVTKSTFNASQAVDGKAAIEMDASLTAGINLTIDAATTATGFGTGNVSGNSLWNNKKGNNDVANNDITVVVGDETVLAPAPIVVYYQDGTNEVFYDMLKAVPYTSNYPKLEGATIKLLADVAASGLRFMENDMVFDLNGHTYTITAGTGSQGTNTSGFQIRPEVTTDVTFKNGTIKVAEGAPVVYMFNNYATNFILEDVTVDCTNMAWSYGNSCYVVVSRGNATTTGARNVEFKGNTTIENFNSSVAGTAYSIDGTMTVGENVECGGSFKLAAGATLTAKEGLDVETVDGYILAYNNGVYATISTTANVATKAELNAALANDNIKTIVLTADIDYGTDQLAITKEITLDLGGKTLTTRNAFGGMSIKGNPTVKNGNIVHASNTAAIKVWNATAFENLVIDVQGKGDANKIIGGIVLQSGSTTRVGSIKNVTIKGAALTNGIETYNCGDATENVIGAMENVTIDAQGTGLLISAPCGTATNCDIKGGVNAVEIFIKGNYSASLELVASTVEGGVYAHDEFSSNPDIVNSGTIKFTADEATTGADAEDVTLTIARAETEKVQGVLKEVMDNAVAKLNNTYYATLQAAVDAVKNGETINLVWADGDAPIAMNGSVFGKNVTITGTATVDWSKGFLFVGRGGEGNATVTFDGASLTSASDQASTGIHVSGREKGTNNKYDGTLVIKNSTIELDYLINKNTMSLDNSTLTVKNGFSIGGRPASETESGADATATISLANNSKVIVNNHNGMGLGYEAIGVMNIDATSTFEATQAFLVTAKGTMNVAAGGAVSVNGTLTVNGTLVSAGNIAATIAAGDNATIEISGGVYTQDVNEWCVDGYAALQNLDGNYVVGVAPTATVNASGATIVPAGEYGIWDGNFKEGTEEDMPLSFVMQFIADQTEEDMETSPYADWFADFVLTFSGIEGGNFSTEGCYLAGYYGDFGWIKVPVEGILTSIEEGVRYPVMLGVGLGQKYEYICSGVKDFRCALYLTPEILAANPNIKVKLELAVVDNNGDSYDALVSGENIYEVNSHEYDAKDFVIDPNYIANLTIDDSEALNFVNDSEKTVGTLTYKRTFVDGVWNALYLPFQVPVEELVENYDIAYYNQMLSYDSDNDGAFDSYEMEVAYLTSGTLRANYPYFIRPKNADACELEYVAEDVTLYPAVENKIVTSSVSNTFTLAGTHKAMSEAELDGYYAISYAGRWEGSTGLKPNRLYLKIENNNDNSPIVPAAAKSVSIVARGEGGTTSIESVDGVNGETVIFDLQGRRVLEPQKGSMYIINGKKVIY